MVQDTEQLLAQQAYHEEEADTRKYGKIKDNEGECKRHGILCRILTALHLKKRKSKHQDHQKLLSESQEHLSHSSKSKKRKKEKKTKQKDSSTKTGAESKTLPIAVPQIAPNKNNNNAAEFATTYEKLDNVSLCSVDLIPVEIEFWDMENEPVDQLPHEILESAHMYSDQRFGQREFDRSQGEYMRFDKQRSESYTAGEYLKHQWKGKNAKKARKGIRTVMKTTWQSLQQGVGTQATLLSPQGAVASAMASSRNRRYR